MTSPVKIATAWAGGMFVAQMILLLIFSKILGSGLVGFQFSIVLVATAFMWGAVFKNEGDRH